MEPSGYETPGQNGVSAETSRSPYGSSSSRPASQELVTIIKLKVFVNFMDSADSLIRISALPIGRAWL
jgi:hypothetical protein